MKRYQDIDWKVESERIESSSTELLRAEQELLKAGRIIVDEMLIKAKETYFNALSLSTGTLKLQEKVFLELTKRERNEQNNSI